MIPPGVPHIIRAWYGDLVMSLPWRTGVTEQFIDALKAGIPARGRRWDRDEREWLIAAPFARDALRIVRAYFPDLVITDESPPHGTPLDDEADLPPREMEPEEARHFRALYLVPEAPPVVVKAAFRALVKINHPDALPVAERESAHGRMVRINAAYEALSDAGKAG